MEGLVERPCKLPPGNGLGLVPLGDKDTGQGVPIAIHCSVFDVIAPYTITGFQQELSKILTRRYRVNQSAIGLQLSIVISEGGCRTPIFELLQKPGCRRWIVVPVLNERVGHIPTVALPWTGRKSPPVPMIEIRES
jgi:hypothetical protein